jgi:3-phosphoshikimate 1-carboxyvinyltransferase
MNLIVKKTLSLQGKAIIPGSKSQSIRAMLFALLAKGESVVKNLLDSEDAAAAQQVCASLGANMIGGEGQFSIKSNGLPLRCHTPDIHTGNSGITTLFTLPLLGLRENCATPIILNCGEQMQARPVKSLVDALRQLGMVIEYIAQQDKLPLSVTGQLKGGIAEVDGLNSQYLSALLISLPCAENDSVITVTDLHERPYVNMTLDFLNKQGIHYSHNMMDNRDIFTIQGRQRYTAFEHAIPGDFSSASCLIAASVLLPGAVELQGLDFNDNQGDKRLVTLLQEMGADIKIESNSLRIQGNKPLKGIRIDANDIPDLVPALAVIATQASGKTEICNVSQARIKETDRIHSMTEGLRKMAARVEEHTDGMTIYQSQLHGASVNGFADHRTVMALTVAGSIATDTTTITDGDAINKTFPQFVATMQAIGADIRANKYMQHVVLIGFKYVGKSLIGSHLAKKLNKKFIDLDKEVEKLYAEKYTETLACRQIMQTKGEPFFRELESSALQLIMQSDACVIALGGGTLSNELNQQLIQDHILLHVDAPRGVVFERIMVDGRPAFFDPHKDPYESFSHLWNERNKIYKKLTQRIVDNSNTIEQAVNQAMLHLHHESYYA